MELAKLIEKLHLGTIVYRPRLQYTKSLDADRRAFNAYNYLKKRYKPQYKREEMISSNYVWICWLQGIEQSPEVVRACFRSVKKNCKGKEIIFLNKDNLDEFINLPDYIISKWKNGIISNAQFSDIVRADLLTSFGGIWIDATVLLTAPLDKCIDDADLFAFRTTFNDNNDTPILISSWFLSAKKNNPIISETRRLLLEYWEEHNVLVNYYLFHIFFSMVVRSFPLEWEEVPRQTNGNSHILQFQLNKNYRENEFLYLCELTNIHKLTYKDVHYDAGTYSEFLIKWAADAGDEE
ncbi:capsular polysaccharide synthesis protein [Enterococcus malodoratus]|uniref:capsular polysaccharide synthesis protein n=1 Tax=Enterococcus malodoratus TaxID=71451 RepID=UPI0022E39BCC|nr:capsular polysaccharide synthesis protein [Enterococcus malodoratus]